MPSPSVHAPFLFLPVCVSLLAHAHPLLALFLCAHPTLPFFSPLRLCSLATPLLLFGSVSSPRDRESLRGERRGTMKSVEPGIQATLAQTERKREGERVISEGCEPRTRIYLYSFVAGITDHPPREITREEIFGIEWTIMRLHLNNLRGVDWVQVGEGGGGFWIRGCRSIAPLSICGRNIEKGIGGIYLDNEREIFWRDTLVRWEPTDRVSRWADSRRDKAHSRSSDEFFEWRPTRLLLNTCEGGRGYSRLSSSWPLLVTPSSGGKLFSLSLSSSVFHFPSCFPFSSFSYGSRVDDGKVWCFALDTWYQRIFNDSSFLW